jgi:accessory gene regulator B
MNFIDKLALGIAQFIRNNHPDAGSEIALKYSLSLIINTLTALLISLAICLITGQTKSWVIVTFSLLLLRYFSGGFHLKSSLSCCIFTTSLITITSHLNFNYFYTGYFLDAISMLILLIKAPQGIENVSRVNPKYYPMLKIVAICIVLSNQFFHCSILSSIFIAQSLTLLNTTFIFFDYIERRLTV